MDSAPMAETIPSFVGKSPRRPTCSEQFAANDLPHLSSRQHPGALPSQHNITTSGHSRRASRHKTDTICLVVMFLVCAAATRRAWPFFSPFELFLQLLFLAGVALAFCLALGWPDAFIANRTPFVMLARFCLAAAPSTAHLYVHGAFEVDSPMGRRWSNNPFGLLGILLFASRALMVCVTAIGLPLRPSGQLLAQTLVVAACANTSALACNATIASAPPVVAATQRIESALDCLIGLLLPLPLAAEFSQRAKTRSMGESVTALALVLQAVSSVVPLIVSLKQKAARQRRRRGQRNSGQQRRKYNGGEVQHPMSNVAHLTAAVEGLEQWPFHAAGLCLMALSTAWLASFPLASSICSGVA